MKFHYVGGCVRDEVLRLKRLIPVSKDIDLVCVCNSFEEIETYLVSIGYEVLHKYEDKFTYRARDPVSRLTYDFVYARTNEVYEGGKLVSVSPGTLLEDLSRRDFTVNAISKDYDTGKFYDPFGGIGDCENLILRCVGNPADRFFEDPRRMMRAVRFMVQFGFQAEPFLDKALKDRELVSLLGGKKYADKAVEELNKALLINPLVTFRILDRYKFLYTILFGKNNHNIKVRGDLKKK
jgi:tRNA nucleotidyltransferase/poly(A) polymerase